MTRLFAVTVSNEAGPETITLVGADRPTEAKEKVLEAFHAIGTAGVMIDDLTVNDLGSSLEEVFFLTEDSTTLYQINFKEGV